MGKGGGNDGGVIACKRYLIKTKSEDRTKSDRDRMQQRRKWRICALSEEPLAEPLVADMLGHLMNKEAVLTYMLSGRVMPAFSHIKSFKRDVFAVKPTSNAKSGKKSGPSADTMGEDGPALYMCPVTLVEANGGHPFVALRKCGCIVSDDALAELKSEVCPACEVPFVEDDVVRLCPNDEEEGILRARMAVRAAEMAAAKATSRAVAATAPSAAVANTCVATPNADTVSAATAKETPPATTGTSGVKRRRPTDTGAAVDSAPHLIAGVIARPSKHTRVDASGSSTGTKITEGVNTQLAATASLEAERLIADHKNKSAVYAGLFSAGTGSKTAAHRW